MAEALPPRWLILVHQLPPHPSNLRVRVWRRLQQIGAVVLRNSLYVLPATSESREDFNWVREEVTSCGGQVSLLEASSIDGVTDTELIQQFRALRTAEYEALVVDIRAAGVKRNKRRGGAARGGDGKAIRQLRERFAAIQARDYFGAAGRVLVQQALAELESSAPSPAAVAAARLHAADYARRTWVTRPRPGIDRIACAWLIRRFIAPDARFAFAAVGRPIPRNQIPFDMPDVEFGHHGSHCSFETLVTRFGIRRAPIEALARVVHDLDLKDARYGMPECVAVGRLVDGLRTTCPDDTKLLEQGIAFMEALYQSFASDGKPPRRRR